MFCAYLIQQLFTLNKLSWVSRANHSLCGREIQLNQFHKQTRSSDAYLLNTVRDGLCSFSFHHAERDIYFFGQPTRVRVPLIYDRPSTGGRRCQIRNQPGRQKTTHQRILNARDNFPSRGARFFFLLCVRFSLPAAEMCRTASLMCGYVLLCLDSCKFISLER